MSSAFVCVPTGAVDTARRKSPSRSARRIRQIAATTTALTFMLQNVAWALCSNKTTFPVGGFTPATGINWSPLQFTGTLGSVWVPDISVNEHNNPGEPVTSGGHDWVFDQGSTTCKATDVGGASGPTTAWSIPAVNFTDCIVLPIFKGTVVSNFGDIPQRGTALTPTCNPAILASNANTYLNQLGCALIRQVTGTVQATTPATATTYLFTAGIKSGLLSYALTSVGAKIPGQEAGKVNGNGFTYYATIPQGQRLDTAAISPDGKWLFGGSSRTNDTVYACLNPLGDPGDPTKPLPDIATFSATLDASAANKTGVQCGAIGQGGDVRIKGLAVGFDGVNYQPFMGGQGIMTNFVNFPACIVAGVAPGTTITPALIAQAFAQHSTNHCKATPTAGLNTAPDGVTALKVETQALVSHGQYLYRGVKGGIVYQAKLAGSTTGTTITQRFFGLGFTSPTGFGFSEGSGSTMIYDDPSALGLAAQERITKLPICEDMP